MSEFDIDQEIEWLREEIEQDEGVLNTRDGTDFHQQRINDNRVKLQELLDAKGSAAAGQCCE